MTAVIDTQRVNVSVYPPWNHLATWELGGVIVPSLQMMGLMSVVNWGLTVCGTSYTKDSEKSIQLYCIASCLNGIKRASGWARIWEHVKKRNHLVKPNPYIFILEPTATLLMMLETK